jgi:HD superfamily phosphodiesterase
MKLTTNRLSIKFFIAGMKLLKRSLYRGFTVFEKYAKQLDFHLISEHVGIGCGREPIATHGDDIEAGGQLVEKARVA